MAHSITLFDDPRSAYIWMSCESKTLRFLAVNMVQNANSGYSGQHYGFTLKNVCRQVHTLLEEGKTKS